MVTNYQGLPVTWSDVLVLITAYLGTCRHSRGASGTGRNRGYATHNLLAVGIWNDYRVVVERPAPRHHAVEKIMVAKQMYWIPPRRSISAIPSSSIRLTQSYRTFPPSVCTSRPHYPMENDGSMPIPNDPGSSSRRTFR